MKPTPDYAHADDVLLMQQLVERDPKAFDELYHRHSRIVFSLCLRVLRDEHEAEQVVLDVFFELWDRADRFNPDRAGARTYLVTLARSRAIDRLRKLRRQPRPGLPDRSPLLEAGQLPPERVIRNEASSLIRDAMSGLSDDERNALEKVYYDGMTHAELAADLDAPLGTVKTWVRRALRKLRDSVNQIYRETPPTARPAEPQSIVPEKDSPTD